MTAIVDYGVGNIFSLQGSLKALGMDVVVTAEESQLIAARRIILPGVGAFGDAMQKLHQTGLVQTLKVLAHQGKPLLGICLGMQLLFNKSHEFGVHEGLGLISGEICPLQADLSAMQVDYKVPHMGWNPIQIVRSGSPLMKNTKDGDYFYYVHSYYAKNCSDSLVATSEYGVQVAGVVQNKQVFGTQFHPEKSGEAGLALLKAFAEV